MSKDLDMRMKPYACVATGVNENMEGVGMIEVVLHSDTINNIQRVFFVLFFWLLFLFSRTQHTTLIFFFWTDREREEKTNRRHTVHN